ncbi:MAG: peptidylprolyl isomerase, partial [Amylibacter sp.]|nr:peptidylprolyl isomerase [Amylibacter sp.]
MRTLIFAMATASLAWSSPSEAQIQNPYAVAILVNDRVITNFEVTQRASLLQALGTRGNLEKVVHEQLIEDRLRLQAAAQAKLTLNDDEIASGVSEFAARSDLTRDQLYQYIEKNGATKESMQAFVHAGLLWRNLVQARFSSLATISNEEIDKTLNLTIGRKKQSILFSEIRLPLNEGNNKKVLELAEELSNSIKTEGEFAAAARQHSQSPSRAKSGRLDWLPAAELPPSLVGQILVLQPGEVTAPIISGQSVGLFQLRGVRSDPRKEQETVMLDYVSVDIPGEPGSKQLLDNA